MNHTSFFSKRVSALAHALYSMDCELQLQENDVLEVLGEMMEFASDPSMARRVVITGVGKNANLAEKASQTYASIGIPSMYANTCHMTHGDFGFIGPEDMVIHVSRSGTTLEMLNAAAHLKTIKPEVTQVLLTCQPTGHFKESSYHAIFDYVIYTGTVVEIDANHLAPTTSTTVLLALLDLLGTYVSQEMEFTRSDFLAYHPGGALGVQLREEILT